MNQQSPNRGNIQDSNDQTKTENRSQRLSAQVAICGLLELSGTAVGMIDGFIAS